MPLAVAVVVGVALVAVGVRHFYAWMACSFAPSSPSCILQEFYKGARTRRRSRGENFFQAIYNLTMRNTRRYGGYVIHLGIVLLFVGFAGPGLSGRKPKA